MSIQHTTRHKPTQQVLSPYRDEARSDAITKLNNTPNLNGEILIVIGFAVVVASFIAFIVAGCVVGTQIDMDLSSGFIAGFSLPSLYAGVLAWLYGGQALDRRKQARLERERESEWVVVAYEGCLVKLSEVLCELSPEARAELRPLWDSAVEANAYLLEVSHDEAASVRIRERYLAAAEVLKEEQNLALTAKHDAALTAYGTPDDDSDILLAKTHAEALRAGRKAYAEIAAKTAAMPKELSK